MGRKENEKCLQVRGSRKWTFFPSNSKLSLTAWSEKKKMTFIDGEKSTPFHHLLDFGPLRHFGRRLTYDFYT